MQRQRRKLTEDRVAIDLRRKDGWGVRAIARELRPLAQRDQYGDRVLLEPDGTYAAGPAQAAGGSAAGGNAGPGRAPDSRLFAEAAKLLRLQRRPP